MKSLRERRGSPALAIAILALVAGVTGVAVAQPAAKKAVTKKKVKKIATKQINKLAPGLSVASAANATNAENAKSADDADHAASADNATNASALDGVDSSAYRRIQLPATGAFLESSANYLPGSNVNSGIRFPSSDFPAAAWAFVLQPDFGTGSPVRVRLTWHTPGTSCGIRLDRSALSVSRSGVVPFGDASDITPPEPNVLNAPATANRAAIMQFTIPGTVDGNALRAGDSISFGVVRLPGAVGDTCTEDLDIHGAEATY